MESLALFTSLSEIARQIVCSEEACVIKIILILSFANDPNNHEAIPGTPTIALP